MPELKTIQYRGGIARFQIPKSWVEEYEPRGGGTFYEPGDDTGTLRINVISFERPLKDGDPKPTAFDVLTLTRSPNQIKPLPRGLAIVRYITNGEENSERLRFYRWEICVCVTATRYHIIAFTYTIVDGQEKEPKMQEELKLLDQLIVAGEYPPVEGISGDYSHDSAGQ